MENRGLFYLVLSRYVTYIGVFISSVLMMENDIKQIVLFSFLFILVLVNSYIRINKLEGKPLLFMISTLIELALSVYMQYGFYSIAFIFLYIIAVDIYLELKVRYAIYMTLPLLLGLTVSVFSMSDIKNTKSFIINMLINMAVLMFFAGAGAIIRFELGRRAKVQALYDELKSSEEELKEANKKLKEYAKMVEDIAVLNERNRLAGEIHDTIGHNLTGLIMEIDICGKLIDRDVERAREELKKASELARNALSEVRRSVRAIKPADMEGHTGINAIGELIRDFEKNTRIIVKFDVSKSQYKLSPTIEVTIYRTIQEALTNCAKYGKGDIVFINLDFREDGIALAIRDSGTGCLEFTKGVGLKTMEERIHSLGGRVDFSGNNGFLITAVIPVEVA